MRKAKIYKPTKTAMQSGTRNTKNWILEYESLKTGISPLMGWETTKDTLSEIKLEFSLILPIFLLDIKLIPVH